MNVIALVIHRAISSYLIKKAGLTIKTGKTGAVTLIQRFGSALNLNIHFHMLFLDGAYELDEDGAIIEFHEITKPTFKEMQMVLHRICERLSRLLEKRGLLCRDAEQSYLTFDYDCEDVINDIIGFRAINLYRIKSKSLRPWPQPSASLFVSAVSRVRFAGQKDGLP